MTEDDEHGACKGGKGKGGTRASLSSIWLLLLLLSDLCGPGVPVGVPVLGSLEEGGLQGLLLQGAVQGEPEELQVLACAQYGPSEDVQQRR